MQNMKIVQILQNPESFYNLYPPREKCPKSNIRCYQNAIFYHALNPVYIYFDT